MFKILRKTFLFSIFVYLHIPSVLYIPLFQNKYIIFWINTHFSRVPRFSLSPVTLTHSPSKTLGKFHKTHFQHNIAASGSSGGNEMIGSMWSYFLFCIFDDIVAVAGCVINVLSCYLNCFLDVTCLFKKYKSLICILIILACTPCG